jgi:hypothetical protein
VKEAKNFCPRHGILQRQKQPDRLLMSHPVPTPATNKSFLLLFFKKEALASYRPQTRPKDCQSKVPGASLRHSKANLSEPVARAEQF